MIKRLFKRKKSFDPIETLRQGRDCNQNKSIKHRSNVIQYDCMGYPLRLVIMQDGTQQWLDTNQEEGDVILEWKQPKIE